MSKEVRPLLLLQKYFKTHGVIGRRKTPWTGDTKNRSHKNKQNKKTPMKPIKNLALAALASTLLFQTSITRADDQVPQAITFQKCFVADDGPFGGHFEGTVDGDCGAGTVVAKFVTLVPGKAIWRFSAEYTITTPGCSFKTVCVGIEDVRTGHIVLNGIVTEGDHLGARVVVRAQDNADLTCSQGTMTITPVEPE
jgi:hypothetical protein